MFDRLKAVMEERTIAEDKRNVEFENGDFLALIIAASSVILPVLIAIFMLIALVVWIIF